MIVRRGFYSLHSHFGQRFYFHFYFHLNFYYCCSCCCWCCCRFGLFTYMHQSWLLWNLLHTFWRVRLHIYYACCAFPHPKRRQQLLLLLFFLLLLFRSRWTIQTTIKCHCILNNRKTCSWIHPHTQSNVCAAFCIGFPAPKTENLIEIYGGRKFH